MQISPQEIEEAMKVRSAPARVRAASARGYVCRARRIDRSLAASLPDCCVCIAENARRHGGFAGGCVRLLSVAAAVARLRADTGTRAPRRMPVCGPLTDDGGATRDEWMDGVIAQAQAVPLSSAASLVSPSTSTGMGTAQATGITGPITASSLTTARASTSAAVPVPAGMSTGKPPTPRASLSARVLISPATTRAHGHPSSAVGKVESAEAPEQGTVAQKERRRVSRRHSKRRRFEDGEPRSATAPATAATTAAASTTAASDDEVRRARMRLPCAGDSGLSERGRCRHRSSSL